MGGNSPSTHLRYNQHPLVISPESQSVAAKNKSLHGPPVSTGPTYANGRVWGSFSQMCYSHQTELVKSQHVVLLLKHFWESMDQADGMLESLFLSVHIPPPQLPGIPPPLFPSHPARTSLTVTESPRVSDPKPLSFSYLPYPTHIHNQTTCAAGCLVMRFCL